MTLFLFTQQPPATSLKQSVKDRLGPLLTVNSEPSQDSSIASKVCVCVYVCLHARFFHTYLSRPAWGVDKHRFSSFFNPLVQNPSKASVKERLGFSTKPAAPVDKVSSALTSLTSKRLSFKNLFFCFATFRCFPHRWALPRLCTTLQQ